MQFTYHTERESEWMLFPNGIRFASSRLLPEQMYRRRVRLDDRYQLAQVRSGPVAGGFRMSPDKGSIMLNWALTFLIVAIIAAVLGFGGIAGDAAWIAHALFVVFLVLFLVSLLVGRRVPPV
jgi:uncharacterized membrane protein YtjA (UPF0391 family)